MFAVLIVSLHMLRQFFAAAGITVAIFLTKGLQAANPPIQLHPDNPHYFLWRGKPTILITAGEHYGAALNRDFDYVRYLDELKKYNFNLTRVFAGTYREIPGSFNITGNTLAPAPDKFVCPWAAGNAEGKFDLTKWNENYFARLQDLLQKARDRNVVVELVLFCTMYDDALWNASPMNARNNNNGVGNVGRGEVFSGKDKNLLGIQRNLARKLATELNAFDNVYFEICNEPYERGGLTREWNDEIVAAIVEAEAALPNKHLIAQGFPPAEEPLDRLNPAVSVLNFHATTAKCVRLNYHLNKPIAFDETGGSDRSDDKYRTEGWDFIIAGGSVYDHLDFSFTTERPNGSAVPLPDSTPGGGGPTLRRQLQILKAFVETFDFIRMKPADDLVKTKPAPGQVIRVLANPGKSYAAYINGGTGAKFEITVPSGAYEATWLDTKTGQVVETQRMRTSTGALALKSPAFTRDIALKIVRAE
jgi:hypothetical protein